jgi:hypothetical protein
MSGPLNSNDIEDFVSSVRRLVSVDERPRPVSRDLAQDRLVLGPAFRVVPDVQDPGDTLILTVPVKDVEVAAAVPEAGPGPGTAHVSHTFEADWEEELWSEPEPPLSELALGAEEAEVIAETWPGSLDEVSAPVETPQADDAPWAEVGEDWLETDQVSATPEEPEEPAAPEAATTAEEATARPDVLKLSAEDMLTDGEGNPLTVLDEAALQQIIRQLIREELKGVLGERITQSVRKLVRAEINRALAAHALD